jgi:succinate-semialdehyde dehydrogenase/glutarate-semialdehyde dehydrogenase
MTQSLFINGRWTAGSGSRRGMVFDPATGQASGEVAFAETTDLDEALAAAARAFPAWRDIGAFERYNIIRKAASLLRERSELVAQKITAEQGKPIFEARIEAVTAADHIDWNAEEGRRAYGRLIPSRGPDITQTVILEPIGPVAGFSPWNFPVTQLVRKIAAALAAGCTIIAKAPEETPSSAIELVRCFEEAGVPAGVLNLVFGVPAEISEHLIASDIIRKVSFTGSVPVGRHLGQLSAHHLKRTTMELGGHSPFIVTADIDLAKVVPLAVGMKFRNAGQVCASPTRFYVEEPIFNRFVDDFVAGAKALVVGPGADETTKMGPLAHKRRPDAVEAFVQDARDRGAVIPTGGRRAGNQGYFHEPTVLTHVPNDARIMNEEPFGPVAIINPVSSLDEAITEANRLPYGLSAYAFTNGLESADRLSTEIAAGTLSINHFGLAMPETPFGGIRDSGHGSEGGTEGLEAYLQTRFVTRKRRA